MARESHAARQERLVHIVERLRRTYPDADCELNRSNPLELLVATILSAQCTDKMVNRVTESLFRKYRTAADYAGASAEEFENDIRSLGFFRNKARSIRACCEKLVVRHGGRVPQTMDELTQLDGVGRKTANVILGNAFGVNAGVVVDTHVTRLAGRLGLTAQTQPEKIERDLMKLVPQKDWTLFSHWLIWHGRRRCKARKPDCAGCELSAWCPSAGRIAKGARRPGAPRKRVASAS
ncbi:MAG: endonuclease III [Verrucomicrobia bacterium]|jgi:endonuclease-3|nr:endonuclease III [Verrucomicrobiota bacterium]MDI9380769.1 endonuclease III [Verrucomicrobiota bacterium]NMD22206.1 endonuclease III [Verrucomicrobiota bacterium]HNU98504.1 endonuclease III [Verrucomicrobiota bacterium]HOA60610.1 endonuclease III [Verrucomicrobiota bacterium]